MNRGIRTAITATLLFAGLNGLLWGRAEAQTQDKFETAKVYMEQNVSDKDLEVVFSIQGGEEGMVQLQVVGPDGRTVLRFDAPDASTLGTRKFTIESPEPSDELDKIKAAYPAGDYVFSGKMIDGTSLRSIASLSHDMPPAAVVTHPADGAEDVPVEGLQVAWKDMKGLLFYLVEVEQEKLGVHITAKLPASTTTFQLPAGFLQAGMEYKLSIGTVTPAGNASFIETSFTTAK